MKLTEKDVFDFIESEDVKFIRLAFCDVNGRPKNISIMPSELKRAFRTGIGFDASAIDGFDRGAKSDLLLFPDPSTLTVLPWRPSHGKVVRMFSDIRRADGTPFAPDSRRILARAEADAKDAGISVKFGAEIEFYLFKTDEYGEKTREPFDHAGYMDVAPEDKGENVRREICLTLLDKGIDPETSNHERGPVQKEIYFRFHTALKAADDVMNLFSVVNAAAGSHGLCADFTPNPLHDNVGNAFFINISVEKDDGDDVFPSFLAGILAHIEEMTAFLNSTPDSYLRLREKSTPKHIFWAHENRASLIRVPAETGGRRRMQLRSPDPMANPYIAYSLLIYAGLDGVARGLVPPCPISDDDDSSGDGFDTLPSSYEEALRLAKSSDFIKSCLPEEFIRGAEIIRGAD
ncbi:MAG: glutamine synthetase family protein [Clostridia bacterium]|nr:glutamine synthetase family protein [Clostridia bacterium]